MVRLCSGGKTADGAPQEEFSGEAKVFLGKWDEPSLDELLNMGRAPPSYPLEPISAYQA
jgi:hypothetical protein